MNNDNPSPNPPREGGSPDHTTWGPKDTMRLLVAGFVGGLMTPMIQPLQEFLKSHHYPSDFDVGYWLVGAALGGLGALMVWLLKETDVKKALILGLSLPAFFTSLGGALQNSGGDKATAPKGQVSNAAIEERGAAAILSFFVTSAYAQQPSPSPMPTGSARSVEVSRTAAFAYRLELLDAKGNIVSTPLEVKPASQAVALALPDNAASVRFTAGDASLTRSFDAKAGQTVDVTLGAEGLRRKFDIAQVFGKTPELVPNQLSAEVKVRP